MSLRKKRTDADFSKHILTIEKRSNNVIYRLKKPNSREFKVNFINIDGSLLITGDFYRWDFCREFHPSSEGFVSDGYWLEKLSISSLENTGEELNLKLTKEQLEEDLEEHLLENSEDEGFEEVKQYYQNCIDASEMDEHEYLKTAYDYPCDFLDCENVVIIKDAKLALKIIFDAFEEICRRLKEAKEGGLNG